MQRGLAWLALWLVLLPALSASAQANAQATPAPVAATAIATAPAPTTPAASTTATSTTAAEPAERAWYGWQILATDASALAIGLGVGAASDDQGNRRFGDVVGSAWTLGAIGSLSVHAAHENLGMSLASLGDRMLVPPIVSLLGLGFGCLLSGVADHCASDGARWSFAIGALGASALDIGAFARERRHDAHAWYGWQSLVIDGAALGVGFIAAVRKDEPDRDKRAAIVLAFPYLTGILISPWVHVFHGRLGVALGDLALRAFGPGLGAVTGIAAYCAATGGASDCISDGAVYGLLGGTLISAAIDIALLGQERLDDAPAHASAATFAPYVTPHAGGVTTGIAAQF